MIVDFLNKKEIASIRTEEKSGMSWLMLQMAICFGAGKHCLDLKPVKALNCLFIDCDLLEEQAAIRSSKIKLFLGIKESKCQWLGLREEEKTLDLLKQIIDDNNADIYFIDGLHWFGRQLDVFTFLRATKKTFIVSEIYRYTSTDLRPAFGYTPADSVYSLYPTNIRNIYEIEGKSRSYTKKLETLFASQSDTGIFEIDQAPMAKKHPCWRRWRGKIEEACWIIAEGKNGRHVIGQRLRTAGIEPKSCIQLMEKEGLIVRVGTNIVLTELGNTILKLSNYDPTLKTTVDISYDMFEPKDNVWFSEILKNVPMPRIQRKYAI